MWTTCGSGGRGAKTAAGLGLCGEGPELDKWGGRGEGERGVVVILGAAERGAAVAARALARAACALILLRVSCHAGGRKNFVAPSANSTKYQSGETRESDTVWERDAGDGISQRIPGIQTKKTMMPTTTLRCVLCAPSSSSSKD